MLNLERFRFAQAACMCAGWGFESSRKAASDRASDNSQLPATVRCRHVLGCAALTTRLVGDAALARVRRLVPPCSVIAASPGVAEIRHLALDRIRPSDRNHDVVSFAKGGHFG